MATKSKAVKSEKPNWKCQYCTFKNKNHENFCEICNTNRNGTPSQQRHQSQIYEYQAKKSFEKSPIEKEIPVDNKCFLCGNADDTKHCEHCNKKSFCDTCRKKYHNHPNRQWHLQLEIKSATSKTADAEFIPIDTILSQLSDITSEHQTQSNNIIDETENHLTNCYAKLNQQLEEINEAKLETNEASSKNKKLYLEYEEKRFEKAKITLRSKFDEFKKAEWLAIGEDLKNKCQKEFNIKWLKKEAELKKTLTNESEAKMQKLLSKHYKEFEQQTAISFKQKIMGMRAVWESNLEKEREEYLISCRQKIGKKTKKKWQIKNKKMSFSDGAIDKEIDKVYGEALEEINNILGDYKLKQRQNLNDLKEKFKMQDMLFDQVEALKQKIRKSKLEISELKLEDSKSKIKINTETNKNANLKQQLDQKTNELQTREKHFKYREQELQESVKYIEKIKAKAENEWDQERKNLEKEKKDLLESLSTWRTKYYEEQEEYLQTIEIFNSNECKLEKDLEKMQKIKQEKEGLINEQRKLNEQIHFIKADFENKKQNYEKELIELKQEKETLKNEQFKLSEQIDSMKIDFENERQNYKKEVLQWQNICSAQYAGNYCSSQIRTAAPFKPNFNDAIEPRDSAENEIQKTAKQVDTLKTNVVKNYFKTLENPFESTNLKPDLKSPITTTSKILTGSEDTSKMYHGHKDLSQLNLSSSNRSAYRPMRTQTADVPTSSCNLNTDPKRSKESDKNKHEFINKRTQLATPILKPESSLHIMMKQPFDKTTNKDVDKDYSNYNRETSNSSKTSRPIFELAGSFKTTSDKAIESSGSNENKIYPQLPLDDFKEIETSKYLENYFKSSSERLEQKLQLTGQPVEKTPDKSDNLLLKNLNEDQGDKQSPLNYTQNSLKNNNAEENWKHDKVPKAYPEVHKNKKSSDNNIQQNKLKSSIAKEEMAVAQETNELIDLNAALPPVNQPEAKKLNSSDLIGLEPTKQVKDKKSRKKKHSTTRDKTDQNQLKRKSPDGSSQKDSNDTSSDDEQFESAEEDGHQSEC